MSWIVQSLLNNRTLIKQKTPRHNGMAYSLAVNYGPELELDDEDAKYDDPFIEDEQFNDLLVIERAIEELKDLGLLTSIDLEVLEREGGGYYNRRNKQRKTHSRKFTSICNRIAYYLGGYFTDEGYINHLSKKYKLSEQQIEVMRNYMKSRFKNKLLSKGYRIENNHEKNSNVSA